MPGFLFESEEFISSEIGRRHHHGVPLAGVLARKY
jgi:hypothetical protein